MKIDLNNLAGGATAESISREIYNIMANIKDPNTDQTAKRKLAITMTFIPDKNDSDIVDISTVCKPTFAPSIGTSTRFVVGINDHGKIEANEWGKERMKGQLQIDKPDAEEEDFTKGRYVDEHGEIHEGEVGVIDLQKKRFNA